jgi:hypothetical protein
VEREKSNKLGTLEFTAEQFQEELGDLTEEKAKTLHVRQLDGVLTRPFEFACSELVGQRLFVFGGLGPSESQYASMFVLNLRKKEWFIPAMIGPSSMYPRIGHTLTRVGRKFYIIGGNIIERKSHYAKYTKQERNAAARTFVLAFDCVNMVWESVPSISNIPANRMHHTTTKIGNTLYVLGGINPENNNSCDFCAFDLESQVWSFLPQPFFGNIHAHTATKVGNKIVVFGGIVGSTISNEVFVYDAEIKVWYKTVIKGLKPPPRCHHTAVFVGRSLWAMFGRDLGGLALDVFVLDLATLTWSKKVFDDPSPAPREGQTAVRVGNSVLFIGGFTKQLGSSRFNNMKVEKREPHLVPLIVETGPRAVEIEHSSLKGDMIRLLESGLYADAKLKTLDDKVLHVHKAILHARSPLLREKLTDEVITIGMLIAIVFANSNEIFQRSLPKSISALFIPMMLSLERVMRVSYCTG